MTKEQRNQRRQYKRGLYERWRRKRWLFFKHTGQIALYYAQKIKKIPKEIEKLKWYQKLWNFILILFRQCRKAKR